MTLAPQAETAVRLPIWRLIAGIGVLVAMAAVLIALAPVYFEDYQLGQYLRAQMRDPAVATSSDDMVRADVIRHAHELDLPVQPGQVTISRVSGKLHVDVKYAVQMDFPLYQVDLHFHPSASAR